LITARQEKIILGGIKISETLIGIDIRSSANQAHVGNLCRHMALRQINTPFLATSRDGDRQHIFLLVAPNDFEQLHAIIENQDAVDRHIDCHDDLVLFSIFPIKGSLTILGRALSILYTGGVKIHGVCSSLSSLVFVIDRGQTNQALEAMSRTFQWPVDHTPFRPQIKIRQTRLKKNT
jgi:aspartokinase